MNERQEAGGRRQEAGDSGEQSLTHRMVIARVGEGSGAPIVMDAEIRSDGTVVFRKCEAPTRMLVLMHQTINRLPLKSEEKEDAS